MDQQDRKDRKQWWAVLEVIDARPGQGVARVESVHARWLEAVKHAEGRANLPKDHPGKKPDLVPYASPFPGDPPRVGATLSFRLGLQRSLDERVAEIEWQRDT